MQIKNDNDLALKAFIRGLGGQIQNNVRLRDPDSLEKAMSLIIEEEDFLCFSQRNNALSTPMFKKTQTANPVNTQEKSFNDANFPTPFLFNHFNTYRQNSPKTFLLQQQNSIDKFLLHLLLDSIETLILP